MRIKTIAIALLAALMAASALTAQEVRALPQDVQLERRPIQPVVPCPFPTKLTIPTGRTPTPVPAQFPASYQPHIAGSVFNQTAADKHFGHTFTVPVQPRV